MRICFRNDSFKSISQISLDLSLNKGGTAITNIDVEIYYNKAKLLIILISFEP